MVFLEYDSILVCVSTLVCDFFWIYAGPFMVRHPYMTLCFIIFFAHTTASPLKVFFFPRQFLAKLDRSTIVCVFSNVSGKTPSFAIFQGDHIPVHFSQKLKKIKITPQAHTSRIRNHAGMRYLSWYALFVRYALLDGMCSVCGARSPLVCVPTSGMRWGLSM